MQGARREGGRRQAGDNHGTHGPELGVRNAGPGRKGEETQRRRGARTEGSPTDLPVRAAGRQVSPETTDGEGSDPTDECRPRMGSEGMRSSGQPLHEPDLGATTEHTEYTEGSGGTEGAVRGVFGLLATPLARISHQRRC